MTPEAVPEKVPSSSSLFDRATVAVALIAVVLLTHTAIDYWMFKKTEVPPFYDAANHFNIAADFKAHFENFEPTLAWFDELYGISGYYPPCYHWVAGLIFAAFQFNLDAARLPNLFFLALFLYGVFFIGRVLFDNRTGLLAALIAGFIPVVGGLTREIYIDLALLAWATVAVAFLLASDRFRHPVWTFLFGTACGFGLLTKWTFPVFIGGPVLWVFSQMFLPLAVTPLLIGLFSSGTEANRLPPVHRFLLTLAGWFVLLYSLDRMFGESPLFFPWAVGALAGLILLVYSQWDRRGAPDFRGVLQSARRSIPPLGRSLLGIVIASIPALLIAGPWYLKHFGFIASEGGRVLTEAAEVRGMAKVGTLDSFLYYFLTLESHQFHFLYWLLAVAALVTLFTRGGLAASPWFLGGAFFLSYLVMSSLWVKDPRYFTPAIYPLPVLMAWWILSRTPDRQPAWICAALLVGVTALFNQAFGLPLLDRRIEVPTPFGTPLAFSGPGVYGNLRQHRHPWPHRDLIAAIEKNARENRGISTDLTIPMMVDDGFLHAPAMNCYSRVLGSDLRFINIAYHPDYRSDPGYIQRLLKVLESPYFITKEGGWLGLDFVTSAYTPLLERLTPDKEGWGQSVALVEEFEYQPETKVKLWSNTFPDPRFGEWKDIPAEFANGIRVKRVRFSRPEPLVEEAPTLFQLEWVPEQGTQVETLVERYRFFVHLVDPLEEDYVQGWNFPLANEEVATLLFHLEQTPEKAIRATVLLTPEADLPIGRYQLRLGSFLDSSLEKVELVSGDFAGFLDLPLTEPFDFETGGWERVSAAFEDRAMLAARSEIGAVVLEAARFLPQSASPGAEIRLETRWRMADLEVETPQEQDVSAFAYLLPTLPDGENGPLARVSWTLRAMERSPLGKGRWTDTVRMLLPSQLAEGSWSFHIGVERPQFQRDFLIRGGDQADRRTFVLDRPLRVGREAWREIGAEFPGGVRLQAGRIDNATLSAGSEVNLDLAWSAKSASALLDLSSGTVLFLHLFSPEEGEYKMLENRPLFVKENLDLSHPVLRDRTREEILRTFHSALTERYRVVLQEGLLPGEYRLDYGLYVPTENRKVAATLPSGATQEILAFPDEVDLRLP